MVFQIVFVLLALFKIPNLSLVVIFQYCLYDIILHKPIFSNTFVNPFLLKYFFIILYVGTGIICQFMETTNTYRGTQCLDMTYQNFVSLSD